ncbi:hypothetical protein [Asaia sp. HumB]|uniref:hypothetical protein n=1 Tax=Asaia sp. HumB TaxID=3035475 RepID=UPI0025572A37|nr:hypothetical protein [Asaia sp. HumB]MDL2169846.1 hypothetical protein [Asaia sp. HumB]
MTFAIRMSISLDYRGKPRRVNAKMTGAEMDALAQKITEQLKRSNMWPHRGPGTPAHQAPDYSVAWRRADDESIDLRQSCIERFTAIRETDMATIRIADAYQRQAENIMSELFSAESAPGQFGKSHPLFVTNRPENGYIDYYQLPGEWADRLIERGIDAKVVLPPSAPV